MLPLSVALTRTSSLHTKRQQGWVGAERGGQRPSGISGGCTVCRRGAALTAIPTTAPKRVPKLHPPNTVPALAATAWH